MQTGYSLIDEGTGLQVCDWAKMPAHCEFRDGGKVVLRFSGAKPGDTFTGLDGKSYRFVERHEVAKPGPHYTSNGQYLRDLTEIRLTLDPQWTFDAEHARATLIAEVKAEAGNRIVQTVPLWRQNNMQARATEIQEKRLALLEAGGGGDLTDDEKAEVAAMQAVWGWIKATRAHSDALEAEIAALDEAALAAWEMHDWPEPPA